MNDIQKNIQLYKQCIMKGTDKVKA